MNTLLKLLKSSVNLLEHKYIRMPLIVILIIYAAAVAPNLSGHVNEIMNNTVVRIFVLLAVVLLAHKDIVLALLLVVAYLMSTGKLVENLKNKDGDTEGNTDGKKKDDTDDTKKDDTDDTEGNKKDDTEGNTDGKKKEKFESEEESDNDEPKSASPQDLDEKELDEEKKVEIENFELNNGCTPEGYNSRYNCFDNTGDASPCSPCGEVGAFDDEIGPQGLSQMTGYPGTEFSQV